VILNRYVLKTTVSWIMVLIRKQYFREHCETVVREYQKKYRIRGFWSGIAKRSSRRTTVPGLQPTGPEVGEEPMSPEEPVVTAGEGAVAALVGGTGVGLSVGLGNKAFQDEVLGGYIVKSPLEVEGPPVRKHAKQRVTADTHSLTSSPRSVVGSLQPVSPTSGSGNPGVRWDERSFGSRQAKTDRNYMRKRAGTFSLWSVRIWADDCVSPSVHDDDTEYRGFCLFKAERPGHGRVPGTN
jgi:hypothetical protein